MLVIIAHHYVVNSGVTKFLNPQHLNGEMIFLQFWGMGGKIAIDCFLLITGYFMIRGGWRFRKAIELYAEIKFYKIIIFLILGVGIYQQVNFFTISHCVFSTLYSIGYGRSFPEVFLLFYLFIPFINKMLYSLPKREWIWLLTLLISFYSVLYTCIPSLNQKSIHYLGWFITLYIIGAYIRTYPNKYTESQNFGLYNSLCAFVFILCSILLLDFAKYANILNLSGNYYYYFSMDSNKLGALWLSVSLFLWVKSCKLNYNKYINWAAKSTLGILLIHANSDLMRRFLWGDLLNVVGVYRYHSEWIVLHALLSVVGVYGICLILDKGREYLFLKCEYMLKRHFNKG